jgi:hypothetical protein
VPPDIAAQGKQLLYQVRIPHHADPTVWLNPTSLLQIALIIAAIGLTRQKALRWLCGIPFSVAMLLTLLVYLTKNPSLALLFPWRVTTVLVPLSVIVLLSRLVEKIPSEIDQPKRELLIWILPSISTALITITILVGWVRINLDFQNKQSLPERPLMEYVFQHKQAQEVYLIPLKMQDFRLTSAAAVYVDFKSTPYHPNEVIEWYRRYRIASAFYRSPSCEQLDTLRQEGISHIVLPHALSLNCPTTRLIYSDAQFELLQIVP